MPDWRLPLPGPAVAAEGQVRLGAARRVVDRDHPGADALAEAEGPLRVRRVDRRREPVAVAVGELDRLVEGAEVRDADDRPEGLGGVDVVVGGHAVDDRRVAVDARRRGRPRSRRAGCPTLIRPVRARARDRVVVADQAEPVLEALGEALVDHRPVEHLLGRVADRRLLDGLVKRSMNSSWIDSCTITVPSEVQRCPAVPKPLKSAPSTARSSSASGITTSGFLPPSSRQGDCTWRPQSAPISEPTADEPVKPTLSTSRSSSARSRPSKAVGPSHWTRLRTPSGRPPAMKSWASASPSAGAYSAGFQTTALPHRMRRHEVPGRNRDREVAGRDDRRHADRVAEGEELLVRHLARDGLAVEPAPLADEEVAGVDDLLDLAERLRIGLADLARDEPGERLLVVLDEPADLLDRLAAHGRRHRGPLALRRARGAAGVHEDVGVGQHGLADDLVQVRGVARLDPLPLGARLAAHDRRDGPRLGDAHACKRSARAGLRRGARIGCPSEMPSRHRT